MKWVALLSVAACSLFTGCAPRFIDVPPAPTKAAWVERDAIETHDLIGNTAKREVALVTSAKSQFQNPEERVIWVSGVDLKNSQFQRVQQRGTLESLIATNKSAAQGAAASVDVISFEVIGKEVSVDSLLRVEKFQPVPKARYYVEFLNKGEMSEGGVEEMMAAWKGLSLKLKDRGLNMSNVVMGGSKYGQAVNEIVVIRVGK